MVFGGMLLFLAAVVVGLAVLRGGQVTRRSAAFWASERGLTLTIENEPMVTGYLRTAGLLRRIGVVAGLVLPVLFAWALGLRPGSGWFGPGWIFAGYLVGALYAEVSLRRPAGRRASATPRRLADYLRPSLLIGQWVLAGLVVAAATAALVTPGAGERLGMTLAPVVVVAALGLVSAPLLVMTERWLVRRPQPVVSPSQLAADDAIRSQSVQSIAASGMAAQVLLLAIPLVGLSGSDVAWLRWMVLPAMACSVAAFFLCSHLGQLRWRVRRPGPMGVA
ncbi:MAG TPA: hypothetical protein VIY72_09875 [Acidimicrobiales bacterium]